MSAYPFPYARQDGILQHHCAWASSSQALFRVVSQHFRFPQESLENGLLNYQEEEQIVLGGEQKEEMKDVGVGIVGEGSNFPLPRLQGHSIPEPLPPSPPPPLSVNLASLIEFGWKDFAIPGMPAATQVYSDPAVSAS